MKKTMMRILATLLTALLLAAAMPAAMAQPGPTPAPNRCTGNPDGSHYWGKWKTKREATCEKEGKKERKCRYCSQTEKKSIKKTDHKWGDWTVTVEATDRSMGQRERTCTVCGTTKKADFYPEGTLKRGDKGDAVKALQNALNAKGYDCGKADGGFGKKTEKAVKAFEASIGFTGDGIAWPAVIAALVGSADTKTASVRMPQDEKDMIAVKVYTTTETIGWHKVPKNSPTDFDLPTRNKRGEKLVWIVTGWENVYNEPPRSYSEYRSGMSFDRDVRIAGFTESEVFTVRFILNNEVVREIKASRAAGYRLDRSDPTLSVIDGKWVEWYLDRNGKDLVTLSDTVFYSDTAVFGQIVGASSTIGITEPTDISYFDYDHIVSETVSTGAELQGVFLYNDSDGNARYKVLSPDGERICELIMPESDDRITEGIYLDPRGGAVSNQYLPAGTETKDFPIPTREHFRFSGWKPSSWGMGYYRVYYAAWEPEKEFTITVNYGVAYDCLTKNVGKFPNYCADYELPVLEDHNGYTFAYWRLTKYKPYGMSTTVDCNLPFEQGDILIGDITIMAVWTKLYYTVTFDMGVWESRDPIKVVRGTAEYTMPDPEKKDGYEFTGWWIIKRTNPDTGSIQVGASSFTPGQAITSDITLQAQYKQTKWYTIHFDAGQGNTVKGTKNFFARHLTSKKTRPDGTLREEDIPSATPGDKKLNFEGWYTADGERVNTETVFTKNTTVYASWSKNPTITFK